MNDNRHLTIICCYAPTMMHTVDSKEIFYEALTTSVRQVPCEDKLMILGDFNARVGSDVMSWTTVLGHHGKGYMQLKWRNYFYPSVLNNK